MSTLHLSQVDSGQTMSLSVGDEIVVELSENPTTGYQWDLEATDSGILRPLSADYLPPVGISAGAGGVRRFHFVATAPGQAALRLKHCRDWEGDDSVSARFLASVEVRPVPSQANVR